MQKNYQITITENIANLLLILINNKNSISFHDSWKYCFRKSCNPKNPLLSSEPNIFKHIKALSSFNGRTAWRPQLKDKIYFAMERHFNWKFWKINTKNYCEGRNIGWSRSGNSRKLTLTFNGVWAVLDTLGSLINWLTDCVHLAFLTTIRLLENISNPTNIIPIQSVLGLNKVNKTKCLLDWVGVWENLNFGS